MEKLYDVAVIGAGSAGTMAMLRAVLNNDTCVVFPGTPVDKKRSRALWVRKVENMPAHFDYTRGIEEPALEVVNWIKQSDYRENLTFLKHTGVARLVKTSGHFELEDQTGAKHRARYVILCTGVMDVQPLIQGTIAPVLPYANAQIVDYCLRCDGHHIKGKSTVVIGHSNVAAWVAIMLHERYQAPLSLLLHGEASQVEPATQELLDMYGIRTYSAAIETIEGDGKTLRAFLLADGSRVVAEMAFVSLGMLVYSGLARELGAELDERGFVKADAVGHTSVDGFYVAGDVMAGTKKQIYTAWDTAVNALDAINQRLRSERRQQKLLEYRKRASE